MSQRSDTLSQRYDKNGKCTYKCTYVKICKFTYKKMSNIICNQENANLADGGCRRLYEHLQTI